MSFFPLSHFLYNASTLESTQQLLQHTSHMQIGESDPNDPPKKRKTRHSKPDLDSMEVDEHEEEGIVEVKPGEEKSGRRGKKTGRYMPSSFFICFFICDH